jgi:hypothetical protein
VHEVFPVLAGAAIGLGVMRISSARLRLVALAVFSLLAGALASLISGELELSLGFIPVDVAQALAAAVLMSALVTAWQRRRVRVR